MRSPGRGGQGFAMTEALIALLVLSIGLLGLVRLQARVFAVTGVSKTQTAATALAQHQLEALRAGPYEQITSDQDQPPSRDGDSATYTRRWTVTESPTSDFKTIRVEVSWQTAAGEPGSVALTSIVAHSRPKPLD
jgi:type IV pilus modification protein PilV